MTDDLKKRAEQVEQCEVEALATCDNFVPNRSGEYCNRCANGVVRHAVRTLLNICRDQAHEIAILREELQEERAAHSRGGVGA